MPRRLPWRALCALAVLALLVVVPAGAHPVAHPSTPRVVDPRPAPGSIVPSGPLAIGGLAIAGAAISATSVRVDGVEVASTRSGEVADHQTVVAEVAVGGGDHIAEVTVTDARGRTASRAWRFTASGLEVTRVSGPTRIETAVAASRTLYPDGGAQAAVLARADDFPDALAGVPLAVAAGGPLLLSARDRLSPESAEELRRVLPPGARVFLLGGASALSDVVLADVATLGLVPERVRGVDRYSTAAAVGERLPARDRVVLVSGITPADALTASAPAGALGLPVLLTTPEDLPEATREFLTRNAARDVVAVGGRGAVSDAVLDEVRSTGAAVERTSGPSRYDTAVAVAQRFAPAASRVVVAGGEGFADALSGGRLGAGTGAPLLLVPPATAVAGGAPAVPAVTADLIGALQPAAATIVGGEGVVGPATPDALHSARADVGGPRLLSVTPAAGSVLSTIDSVVLEFDRPLAVEHSSVYVTVGGVEVPGSIAVGDFPSTVVFTASEVPPIPPGQDREVRIEASVLALDDAGVLRARHLTSTATYRKLDLSRGDSGPLVSDLQTRLEAAGYWVGSVDGSYGTLTVQAVMAFQKVHGLPRDGVYGPRTRQLLESGPPRPAARSASGLVMEVDKARQVLLMVRDGQVEWVFNTSTGTERPYTYEGQTYMADTPPGRFRITRQIDGVREGNLGRLYRPKYFHPDGIAIHGSASVPAYPASHGCVRVTNAAMDWMWAGDRVPLGTAVWVY